MTVHLTLVSGNDLIRRLVADFARGLGCAVETVPILSGVGIRIRVPDIENGLLELLTHVALSATKAGVDVTEPLCHVTYRHGGAPTEVRLALRMSEFGIDSVSAPTA